MSVITPEVVKDWLSPMPVDGHLWTAEALMVGRMQELFLQLESQIQRALPLQLFDTDGLGTVALLRHPRFRAHLEGLELQLAEARQYAEKKASKGKKGGSLLAFTFS
jgi:hypothetical protein